jgi:hypothetical protein
MWWRSETAREKSARTVAAQETGKSTTPSGWEA